MYGTKKKVILISLIFILGIAILISAAVMIITRNSEKNYGTIEITPEKETVDLNQPQIEENKEGTEISQPPQVQVPEENTDNPQTNENTETSKDSDSSDVQQTTPNPNEETQSPEPTTNEISTPSNEQNEENDPEKPEQGEESNNPSTDEITENKTEEGPIQSEDTTNPEQSPETEDPIEIPNNDTAKDSPNDKETNSEPIQTEPENKPEPKKIDIHSSIVWNDNNNQDGKRPQYVTVDLLADGVKIDSKRTTAAEGWKLSFLSLDESSDGHVIDYKITINKISGYTTQLNKYNITNTHEPEKISFTGKVFWKDDENKDKSRPASINVKILADGKEIATVKLTEQSGWSWKIENISKYRNEGKEIVYSVSTEKLDRYTTTVNGINITNTVIPKPEIEIPTTEQDNPPKDVIEDGDFNQEMENLIPNMKPAQITILSPQASGTLTKENESAIIDYSNTKDGYVMIKYTEPTTAKLKVQIKGATTTYTYNITAGEWAVLPFSDGSGEYAIKVFKNVTDNKYSSVISLKHTVVLEDEFAPFVRPNQYVNYENATNSINTASQLLNDEMTVLQKVKTIYDYISKNIVYDYEKSYTVQSGYLPDLDKVLREKKGICFDYASLMTGMLRSQNIPCKLVIGYADEAYHAWISVWSPETGWINNAIFFNGINWQLMDPTFAAGGIEDFSKITYTTKYIY